MTFHRILTVAAVVLCSTVLCAQTTPQIKGSVFGGGRMASVGTGTGTGTVTANVTVNASAITGGIYGGNDITGSVNTLSDGTASAGVTINNKAVTAQEVYGGGNGYYQYKIGSVILKPGDVTLDNAATAVATGTTVLVFSVDNTTYNESEALASFQAPAGTTYSTLMPQVATTSVQVGTVGSNAAIDLGQVYGGAKNAVVGTSSCTINNGTVEMAFAGNNYGGSIANASLVVNGTNTASGTPDWSKAGTDFGIGQAYGGGNAATVSTKADLDLSGGQVGMAFGGNNLADMYIVPSVYVKGGTINTVYGGGNAGSMKGVDYGTVDYSQYISNLSLPKAPTKMESQILPFFTGTDVMIDNTSQGTAGATVNSVFGGCRAANVDNSTYVRLTKGTVGSLFGGCDIAGSVGFAPGTLTESVTFRTYLNGNAWATVKYSDGNEFKLGDKTDNKDMVYASTYLKINGGTVSNVYGSGNGNYTYTTSGNTVSVTPLAGGTQVAAFDNQKLGEPFVTSARVCIEGGSITGNVYGGGLNATLGHKVTQTDIDNADAAHKNGSNYKMYDTEYAVGDIISRTSYLFLGSGSDMTITGNIFGGGCLANVYGTMDIIVKSGTNLTGALYAGNDASGMVMGTGRGSIQANAGTSGVTYGTMLMDPDRNSDGLKPWESFSGTTLTHENAQTYVRVEEGATVAALYGGGNGDYNYGTPSNGKVLVSSKSGGATIGYAKAESANKALPLQTSTWVDVAGTVTAAYGGGNVADIETSNLFIARSAKIDQAFGGGNSATVTKSAHIWVDCDAALDNATETSYNVKTLFGGNNLKAMDILPTIYLWCGKIGIVYGGGNAGDMRGADAFALDFTAYKDNSCLTEGVVKTLDGVKWLPMFSATEVLVDSPYRLSTTNDPSSKNRIPGNPTETDKALQSGLRINAVYGGCKAANVDNSTYTRITRADYVGVVYGGNDIAGTVGMKPGTFAQGTEFVRYKVDASSGDQTRAVLGTLGFSNGDMMTNAGSYVCVTGGTMPGHLFGGGNGASYDSTTYAALGLPYCSATLVALEGGTVQGNVYGGGNQADVKYSLMGNDGKANDVASDEYKQANPFCNNSHLFIGETARKKSNVTLSKVFGGGNMAGVAGNTHISIDGSTISEAVYGGCNSSGTVGGDSKIDLHKGTIGASGQNAADQNVLFGGGFGSGTSVAKNVYVTVSGGTVNGTTYGGGQQGLVNTACDNVTSTTVTGGTILGDIYGGALLANVNGKIKMDITGGTFRNIFAANNQGGDPQCEIDINYSANGDCNSAIYGGGNQADYTGNTQVVFNKGTIGYIYGGANMANVTGNTYVYLLGGEVCHDVFGGGKGAAGQNKGNVSGSTNVYVLDDRLDAKGNYVVSKDAGGNTTTASTGQVLTIGGSGEDRDYPVQPKGWTDSWRSKIVVKGNIYGGGSNGNVGGKTNVVIGSGK